MAKSRFIRVSRWLAMGLTLIVIVIGFMLMRASSYSSEMPEGLGAVEGQLAPCPNSPNCVSTTAESGDSHYIEPIKFSGSTKDALAKIKEALDKMSRVSIADERGNYLRAEAKSLMFGFIDDVEFLVDEKSQQIHFRSASRVGYGDFNANRKRMEKFRSIFEGDN